MSNYDVSSAIQKQNPWDSACRDGKSMTHIFAEETPAGCPAHFVIYKRNHFGACLRRTEQGIFIQIIDRECVDGEWVLGKAVDSFLRGA
jgi:hypothetical protein